MLIPQSLAYALLAGLPPEIGLYASMAPLVLYAIFGTSRALAVGPVAVASLMTAAAAGQLASQGSPEYYGAAIALAMVSGLAFDGYGLSEARFFGKFLKSPCYCRFYHSFGLADCCRSIGAGSGYQCAWRKFFRHRHFLMA